MSTPHGRPSWLNPYIATIEAIVALLHPHAEAVVHNIETDRIVAIWNGFSHRVAGDPSLLDQLPPHDAASSLVGPYEKVSAEGRRITSVSAILADPSGARRGLLCINFDRSPLDGAMEFLSSFAVPVRERPPELFERDWREQIALAVDGFCRSHRIRRDRMDRSTRLALVRALNEKGLFATRNAASHAALAIGISRAAVYSLLKEVRAS